VQLEQMEAKMSEGDVDIDMDQYGRLAGHLRRILESLGMKRVARPVNGPLTLAEISARIKAERPPVGPL
jgi:hypothetical protein